MAAYQPAADEMLRPPACDIVGREGGGVAAAKADKAGLIERNPARLQRRNIPKNIRIQETFIPY